MAVLGAERIPTIAELELEAVTIARVEAGLYRHCSSNSVKQEVLKLVESDPGGAGAVAAPPSVACEILAVIAQRMPRHDSNEWCLSLAVSKLQEL